MPFERRPKVLTCLLAETIKARDYYHTDLLGVFNVLEVDALPHRLDVVAVHLELADGEGSGVLQYRLVNPRTQTVQGPPPFRVTFAPGDFFTPDESEMRGLTFEDEGVYRLQVLVDGQVIAERPLFVRLRR